MERLREYLKQIPEGAIKETAELEKLLAESWDDLTGDDGGMKPWKLIERMGKVTWSPPMIRFVIERHGATQLGSSRAELQHWTIDVDNMTANVSVGGYRQVWPRQAALDVNPIAEKVVQRILKRQGCAYLKWSARGRAQVLIGKILPDDSAAKETLIGRRARLSLAIHSQLVKHGWKEISHSWYEPPLT